MRKPHVLLDVDGVLADFVGEFLINVEMVTGRVYTRWDVTDWDIGRALKLSPEEEEECYRHARSSGWWSRLQVLPGAVEGVRQLREVAEVTAVTAVIGPRISETAAHERVKWLQKHFGFATDDIILTTKKHVVQGDFFVDDHVENVRRWQENWKGQGKVGIVWETPHNRNEKWSGHWISSFTALYYWIGDQ